MAVPRLAENDSTIVVPIYTDICVLLFYHMHFLNACTLYACTSATTWVSRSWFSGGLFLGGASTPKCGYSPPPQKKKYVDTYFTVLIFSLS